VESLRRRGLALVRRGHLIREHVDASGARNAIDAVGPGSSFPIEGVAAGAEQPRSSVYAVTRALICTCEEQAVHDALEAGGSDALDLYALEREAGRRAERLAGARARGSSPEKVAALLCALADELRPGQAPQRIPIEFQHRDLAGLLSIRHESVCRILRAFERQELIARDAEGIAITDRDRLERVGPRSARS
jgi:CRP-like cAMP-binding protein